MHLSMAFLAFLLVVNARAQPPELSVVFVNDADGTPMIGPYVGNTHLQRTFRKPHRMPWTVQQHFTVSADYPYSTHEVGGHKSWLLSPDTITWRRKHYLRARILDCWCIDQYLLVIKGEDTMRIDVPGPGDLRSAFVDGVVRRSGLVSSPEVVRFRPGRFTFAQVANNEHYSMLEMLLAEQLVLDRSPRTQRTSRKKASR